MKVPAPMLDHTMSCEERFVLKNLGEASPERSEKASSVVSRLVFAREVRARTEEALVSPRLDATRTAA